MCSTQQKESRMLKYEYDIYIIFFLNILLYTMKARIRGLDFLLLNEIYLDEDHVYFYKKNTHIAQNAMIPQLFIVIGADYTIYVARRNCVAMSHSLDNSSNKYSMELTFYEVKCLFTYDKFISCIESLDFDYNKKNIDKTKEVYLDSINLDCFPQLSTALKLSPITGADEILWAFLQTGMVYDFTFMYERFTKHSTLEYPLDIGAVEQYLLRRDYSIQVIGATQKQACTSKKIIVKDTGSKYELLYFDE